MTGAALPARPVHRIAVLGAGHVVPTSKLAAWLPQHSWTSAQLTGTVTCLPLILRTAVNPNSGRAATEWCPF